MTLIKCPNCGHTISSVASRCPQCGNQLSQFRFVQGEGGALTECRRCARKVLSGAKICPYCGASRPGRQFPMVLLPLAVALAVPVLVISALRNRGPQAPAVFGEPAAERPAPVAAASAPPVRLAPSVPEPAAAPGAALGAPADSSAAGVPTQTKWTLDWANVREGRALETPVVRVLHPGAAVQVTDRQQGWWALYLDGHVVGYVAGSVLGDRPPVISRPDTVADGHD
jgi:RNA polymerase subunit RPABC4/transcription elongation factor Spt4